jgi:GNAT superfamily N-acetyltransferase
MTEMPAANRIAIRTLGESDLPEVARLSGQLGYPASLTDLTHRLAELASSPEHGLFVAVSDDSLFVAVSDDSLFVAEAGGEGISGWIHVRGFQGLTHAPEAEIVALVVDEPRRGHGVGAALVGAAEGWARARSLPRIRVRCQIRREDAHRFYAREGYALEKTQHVFSKGTGTLPTKAKPKD